MIQKALLGVALAVACAGAAARAQQQQQPKEPTGSVSGRVTSDDKGLAKVVVLLMPHEPASRPAPAARAVTNAEGFYRLSGVPPGNYRLMPLAHAFVDENPEPWRRGQAVTLSAGEHVEGFDFALRRGGVITGRVTDAEGNPVVGERVSLSNLDDQNNRGGYGYSYTPHRNVTDDRGVYRIYGLAPGRYRVSVGEDAEGGRLRVVTPNGFFRRTFHPDTTDEARARVVEVSAGGEASGVDITVGKRVKTYRAAGRLVNAETGRPVPHRSVGYGATDQSGQSLVSHGGMAQTNSRGEFQIEGLSPGRYMVFAEAEQPQDWYSEVASFEVSDADVAGLEVKIRRGASLSGVVEIEGVRDRAALARLLGRVTLYANPTGHEGLSAPGWGAFQVAPDGTFRINGLRAGTFSIALSNWPPIKGLLLLRIEHNGVEAPPEGVEVAEGAQVAGLRVVLAHGSGRVRGQVQAEGGAPPPPGLMIQVTTRRAGSTVQRFYDRPAQVDARGRFTIEGLPAGAYELTLHAWEPRPAARQGNARRPQQLKQEVTVADDAEAVVTFTLEQGKGGGVAP